MIIPEEAINKNEYQQVKCLVQGKKLLLSGRQHGQDVVMVCVDGSVEKVLFDGNKFSSDMIK